MKKLIFLSLALISLSFVSASPPYDDSDYDIVQCSVVQVSPDLQTTLSETVLIHPQTGLPSIAIVEATEYESQKIHLYPDLIPFIPIRYNGLIFRPPSTSLSSSDILKSNSKNPTRKNLTPTITFFEYLSCFSLSSLC